MSKRFLSSILFFCSSFLNAQAPDSVQSKDVESYFRFNYDNDLFSGTDRYYTQGIVIDLVHPLMKHSPLSYLLPKLTGAKNYYGLHIEQDAYTPKDILYRGGQIYFGERPYSAVFFVSHTLNSLLPVKKLLLQTQVDFGFLGPIAKGEEEQKAIHKATNNAEPLGWQNQLSNAILVNYDLKLEKGLVNTNYVDLNVFSQGRLGTLFTDLAVGINSRFGILSPYFNSLGLEKSPAKKFKIYGLASSYVKLVGFNATLQGGLSNSKNIYELPDRSIRHFVALISGGIVVAYKRMSIEFSKVSITPEFKGGVDHGWGKCVVSVCF